MAKFFINGSEREVGNVRLLTELLVKLEFTAKFYAVAVNDSVIPRSEHESIKLKEGDRIEIIHAVGGG